VTGWIGITACDDWDGVIPEDAKIGMIDRD
jgi:hypothetical protein